LAGKLIVAPAVFLATPSAAGAPLIHLKDTKTHISYLVDTGAAISLLPFSSSQHPSGPKLINASGASIPSWNFVFKNLKFGNHTFVHSFLQSAVSQPILGMDFLSLHDLQIDLKHSKVLFPSSTPPPSPPFTHLSRFFFHSSFHSRPFFHAHPSSSHSYLPTFFGFLHFFFAWPFSFCHFPSYLFLAKTQTPNQTFFAHNWPASLFPFSPPFS
jgi:hypothetical protein